jgi:uncharacterized membrane protein (UPF0182 family)
MSSARMTLPKRRRWPAVVIVVLVLLAVLFTVMSQFYVDLLWFREVDLTSVFWTTLRTKVVLGVVFGVVFFALLYVNLIIVRRFSPTTRVLTPDQEVVERIRQSFEPYLRWILPVGAAVLALLVGIGVSGQWQTYLLWKNSSGVTFGHLDPLFERDPAFYIFSLPWLRFLQGWLFSVLVGVTFLVTIAHFLWGGIRPQAPGGLAQKVDPAVQAHLSVLLGLIMLVKAWGYYLGRFDLLTSPRGVVEGASYTDVKAQLPALNFLIIVAVICALLFFANIRVRVWALPIIAVGLLVIVSVLLGTAYPAFVQRFRVAPQEFQREEPYIKNNIDATRTAFALDTIDFKSDRAVDVDVSARDIRNNQPTISNIRLWRPPILGENFKSLQRIRQYYDFLDVDVDRYQIDGEERVQMVSGREVTQDGIPSNGGTWQNRHLVYTHGYGAVAAQVNAATTEGAPVFTTSNIPPAGIGPTVDPQELNALYYGEGVRGDAAFVIVNSKTPELNYEGAPPVPYTGSGGIPMGNALQRALFAWRYRDVNLLISGQIEPTSRIMIYRDIYQRVPRAAPFLTFDSDPYLVIAPDGLKWIWDAYTTTNEYPYSEAVDLAEATQADDGAGGLNGSANYVRNSVKVVVDAYSGTMDYYADLNDPIIQVWSNAFPDLFTPRDQAPQEIIDHFRYPENLFQVQATQFANYHVTDPSVFYQKQDFWQIPADPTLASSSDVVGTTGPALRPYYVLMKVPGETTEHFQLILPFVPEGRQNMVAWMAADSDPDNYGKIVAFQFPTGVNIDGPGQVFSRINQNPQFSTERTLLGQGGSEIQFGDFLVIPVENSFIYVQPIFVRSTQTTAIPELKRVIVANGTAIGLGDTIQEALANSVSGQVPDNGSGDGGAGTIADQVASLLGQALQHFQAADTALKAGQLGTYQSELAIAEELVQQANDLAAQEVDQPTASASPSVGATPSASASPSG